MESVEWDRARAISSVRADIWRFISQAAVHERDLELEAAALLQMPPHEVRTLAHIHFIDSPQVEALLDHLPLLVRQLRVTSTADEEVSADRVRGSIRWSTTMSARAASGVPSLYVTTPARRAYDTPENAVLVFALDAIRSVGKRTGWHRSSSRSLGREVRDRVAAAERWLTTRTLAEIRPLLPTPQQLACVRTGRAARRYQAALDVVDLYNELVRRSNPEAVREAVERHALVTSRDDVLLELMCGFAIERSLRELGWHVSLPGLVRGGVFLEARKGDHRLELYYQRAPEELTSGSVYREVQRGHQFAKLGGLKPDYAIKLTAPGGPRWILLEVKGLKRSVQKSARAALCDLLTYRHAFHPVLSDCPAPYGIGVAWGGSLDPDLGSEIALCTPDRIKRALEQSLPS